MSKPCQWPEGACECARQEAMKPDPKGRVWMHCETGLKMTKTCMGKFMVFCLEHDVEIGDIYAFNPEYPRSLVCASVLIHRDYIPMFERDLSPAKLREPPTIRLS